MAQPAVAIRFDPTAATDPGDKPASLTPVPVANSNALSLASASADTGTGTVRVACKAGSVGQIASAFISHRKPDWKCFHAWGTEEFHQKLAEQGGADIVFLHVSDLSILKSLRKAPAYRATQFILIDSYSTRWSEGLEKHYQDLGATMVLTYPVLRDQIFEAIERVMPGAFVAELAPAPTMKNRLEKPRLSTDDPNTHSSFHMIAPAERPTLEPGKRKLDGDDGVVRIGRRWHGDIADLFDLFVQQRQPEWQCFSGETDDAFISTLREGGGADILFIYCECQDLIRRLRCDPEFAAIPIVVIDSYAIRWSVKLEERYRSLGATAVITLPVLEDVIFHAIGKILPEALAAR